MVTELDIEAARKRWISNDYPIANREHTRGLDAQVLADAFVSQQSQPVNERLITAAKKLLHEFCSYLGDRPHESEKAMQAAEAAIAAVEAEIEERRKPVTAEWLAKHMKPSELSPAVYGYSVNGRDCVIRVEPRNKRWFVFVTQMQSRIDFGYVATRGDVLELLRVIGGEK